ncbi:hypothetical protein NFJ02_33g83840 [Pycnococcus provasolii]
MVSELNLPLGEIQSDSWGGVAIQRRISTEQLDSVVGDKNAGEAAMPLPDQQSSQQVELKQIMEDAPDVLVNANDDDDKRPPESVKETVLAQSVEDAPDVLVNANDDDESPPESAVKSDLQENQTTEDGPSIFSGESADPWRVARLAGGLAAVVGAPLIAQAVFPRNDDWKAERVNEDTSNEKDASVPTDNILWQREDDADESPAPTTDNILWQREDDADESPAPTTDNILWQREDGADESPAPATDNILWEREDDADESPAPTTDNILWQREDDADESPAPTTDNILWEREDDANESPAPATEYVLWEREDDANESPDIISLLQDHDNDNDQEPPGEMDEMSLIRERVRLRRALENNELSRDEFDRRLRSLEKL